MKLTEDKIESKHKVGDKTIIILKCVEPTYKPKKKKVKAKSYFQKIKNIK